MNSLYPVQFDDIVIRKSGKTILGPISHTFSSDGVTMVIGPNGAGKTTLLKALHGLERTTSGQINWPILAQDVRRKQAFVFQLPRLLRRNCVDNIAFPLLLDGVSKDVARERARKIAHEAGLGHVLQTAAESLSAGEKQKLAIARALVRKPEMLLLDEPTANLDGRSTKEIETLLKAVLKEGTHIVMATHDMWQANRLANDVIFLNKGRIGEAALASDFFNEPTTVEARSFMAGDILE